MVKAQSWWPTDIICIRGMYCAVACTHMTVDLLYRFLLLASEVEPARTEDHCLIHHKYSQYDVCVSVYLWIAIIIGVLSLVHIQ